MAAPVFDPLRLDVEAFAKAGETLAGRWPLAGFDRLADAASADQPPADADEVAWTARGERRLGRGGEAQTWLHLSACGRLALVCQRCLKPVEVPVELERGIRFVAGEDAAAQIDSESEDDVLALTRALDLRELVEDEMLLAIPLVPRHDVCPEPLPVPVDDESAADAEPSPFAALATLRRGGPVN